MNPIPIYSFSSILKANRRTLLKKIAIHQQEQFYTVSTTYTASCCDFLVKDQSSIASALNASVNTKSPILGSQIHAQISKLGFGNDVFSLNNLIKMYSKCGYFHVALKVFDDIAEKNLVSWTLIITGAAQNGEFEMGFEAFCEMRRIGLLPNEFALGSLFKMCNSCISSSTGGYRFRLGLCVHCLSLKIGIEKNPFVASSVLNMYAKCGDVEAFGRVFEGVKSYGDVGCWNSMIGCYAQCGFGFEAVKISSLMHSEGLLLDEYSFSNALNGCSLLGNLEYGEQIHGLVIMYGMLQSASVMNSLIDMYFKSGRENTALKLFRSMENKDVVSWNTLFSGFSQDAEAREIVSWFHKFMLSDLKPNSITFSSLINLSSGVHDLYLGLQFYCLAFRYGFSDDSLIVSSLINMLSRCGSMEMSSMVYDDMPSANLNYDIKALTLFHDLWARQVDMNDSTVSCALRACLNTGDLHIGKQIHGFTVKCGFGFSTLICGSLIKLYVKFGLLDDSLKFFYGPRQPHLVTWGVMVSVLGHYGLYSEAMKFLKYMRKNIKQPDDFILSSILDSCASLASHCLTKSMHALVIKTGFELHMSVASAIIDAYSKCGDLESAKVAFELSSDAVDVVVFNTMIIAYAQHGLPLESIQIFEKMKAAKVKPSQATFVSVISACRHAGLVDLGQDIFKSISLDYGMEPSPDNYGCLVDLLSRNGFIEDAKNIIELMPFPPWPAIWRSVLSGCVIHGNRELGDYAYRKLFQFFPNDYANYILYAKLHSGHGNREDTANFRSVMIEAGVTKDAGCSWIEV